MNIPLDRLYQYIENIAEYVHQDRVIIYRFFPHGSKNIVDLTNLRELKSHWFETRLYPTLWCHDQEPLNHEFYSKNLAMPSKNSWRDVLTSINKNSFSPTNLNYQTNIFDKGLLLHSEKRSTEISKYRADNELITVYYWSHAVIARDWFRYAEHVTQKKQTQKIFLIYNRAWSGTREYRLKFAELLIKVGLENCCQTSINNIEPELGIPYKIHEFKNSAWRPNLSLENFFTKNTAQSHYSADFDIEDYEDTDIEVVLETLFDDGRLHLTEKSLRPIACAQPFILAGTHGSLEYLRSYGFKTFNHIWDEGYDLVEDPEERLIQIVHLMQQIANWTPEVREHQMAKAQKVADYNKKHFFSTEFFQSVINELQTNLKIAFDELDSCNNYIRWYTWWKNLLSYPEVVNFLNTNQNLNLPTMNAVNQLLLVAQHKLSKVATEDHL
jgi:hypothetical protein